MSVAGVVRAAKSEIGYRESGTNLTKFNRWFGQIPGYPHDGLSYPWCHTFVSWVLAKGGEGRAGPRTAGCEVGVAWFKARGRYLGTPEVGDLVYYGPHGGTHVELVVAKSATTITTVGGNTSGSLNGQYFNGDGVYQKKVSRASGRINGYGRPVYSNRDEGDDMPTYVSVDKTERSRREQLTSGKWRQIFFDANRSDGAKRHHGDGDWPSLVKGGDNGTDFSGTISLAIAGLPAGVSGQIRAVEVAERFDDWVVVEEYLPVEFSGTPGDTFPTLAVTGHVGKGNRLRVEVVHFGEPSAPAPATVVGGQVRLQVWER